MEKLEPVTFEEVARAQRIAIARGTTFEQRLLWLDDMLEAFKHVLPNKADMPQEGWKVDS